MEATAKRRSIGLHSKRTISVTSELYNYDKVMINELILLNLSPDQRLVECGQLCPSEMGTSSLFCLEDHPQALYECPSVHVRYFKA